MAGPRSMSESLVRIVACKMPLRILHLLRHHHLDTYLIQANVVRIPGDHRYAQVAGQLEQVLGGGGIAAPRLRVGHVEYGGHILHQQLIANGPQYLGGIGVELQGDHMSLCDLVEGGEIVLVMTIATLHQCFH